MKMTTAAENATTKVAHEGDGVKVLDQSATDKKESQGANSKNSSQLDSNAESKAHVNATRW